MKLSDRKWRGLVRTEYLIELGIYMIFAAGAIALMWDEVELLIARIKLRHRLKALKTTQKKLPPPLDYFEKLLAVSFDNDRSRKIFLAFEFALFLASYALGYRNFGPLYSAIISITLMLMPVLFLAARLESSRAKASKEGISLVTELYRQYRINNLNIYEAIEKSVEAEGDYKLSSKKLYSLLIHLRASCGVIEIRDAIDNFVFSFGTSWARILGVCIRMSVETGTDISMGLSDIADQLKKAYNLEEKRKMMNSEATRMTLLLIPLMYIICMGASVFYLGLSPRKLIENQFLNPKAYFILLLIIFLFLVNFILLFVTGNSKLDY